MPTWENNVEATALRKQGWTISAIARHLGHDRKTILYRRWRARTDGIVGMHSAPPDAVGLLIGSPPEAYRI